jgi:uncharacterized protein YbjT (DUF2867 family)
MSKQKTLVIGGTGQVGGEIVRILAAQGVPVRVAGRKQVPAKGSIERVAFDATTGEGLQAAFEGVDRAFLMSPPGLVDMHKALSPLIQEAKRRGLAKVVLMTALGANASDTPFRRAEQELESSGLPYNIIRPNWFMQNFETFWVQGIRSLGKVALPAGRAKTSFIDSRDIAAVAAKLLTDDSRSNQAFDLTGPRALDHDQVASAIASVTGRRIAYEDIPPETLRQGLVSAGVPADYAGFLLVIFGFLREGYNAPVTDHVRKILGRDPAGFEQYAQEAKAAWA